MALFQVSYSEDEPGRVQTDKVAGGFETEACVGAGDDDGLAVEGLGRDGEIKEKVRTEVGERYADECGRGGGCIGGHGEEVYQPGNIE